MALCAIRSGWERAAEPRNRKEPLKPTVLTFALMALGTCTVWAGSICPASSGGANPFPHNPDAAATGCNVVITINADRSTTVTVADATPYENSDDVLIGVKNNSSSSVPNIGLTGSNIFGLEGDGICTFTFVGSTYCTAGQTAGTDPGDYYGPNTTYVITNANSGTVNFTSPIAAGGSAYFSLEGVPTANLAVVVAPSTGTTTAAAGAPAMSVGAMLVLASMLIGFSMWTMRQQRQKQD
jgi:hypothetical protein